ncbi:MAG: phosphoribosylformylglycinamidine cyclo-ligase [Chitinophagaceae bacterium]|nr:phosphoribosylformylglycinamidine cyclo-ligase [Chitinophagaceae bacterium]
MNSKYKSRGVSAQKEDVHEAIKNLDKGLFPNAFCKILPDYIANDEDYCCIMHADTAGTKSVLAYLYWKETGDLSVWKGIAQDAMVMNIDDMICAGATNHFVLSSTIARNKNLIPKEVLSAVINGCEELIQEWKKFGIHIHSAGGETADVGDVVRTIDVGYTAFARFKKENVIKIDPKPGDLIVGFASYGKASYETEYNSGIGCNGLTSARHDILNKTYSKNFPESYDPKIPEDVMYIGNHRLTDKAENGIEIGKMILSPTRTFAPIIKEVVEKHHASIHGIVHNTGGAHTKSLKYFDTNVQLIKDHLFTPPLIFHLIQKASNTSIEEMYQVFNMGTRLELYASNQAAAEDIITIAQKYDIEAQIIGRVEKSNQKGVSLIAYNGQEISYH